MNKELKTLIPVWIVQVSILLSIPPLTLLGKDYFMPPKKQRQQPIVETVPQHHLIWGEFQAFADDEGISLEDEADWLPRWKCFLQGYKTARIPPKNLKGFEQFRKTHKRQHRDSL